MKFEIEGQKYDTNTLSRLQVRVLISKINKRLGDAEKARLESIRNLDDNYEKIKKAEEGLRKIMTLLKKEYETTNKI